MPAKPVVGIEKGSPAGKGVSSTMIRTITDKTQIERRHKNLVAQHVTPLLREAGFRKKGTEYSRAREGLSHLVSIQTSQWNDQNELGFTINCGVLVPGVIEVYANKKVGAPKIEDCSMHIRIGSLTAQKTDLWWSLKESAQQTDSGIGQDVADKLHELILPFLDQFNTTSDVIDFLTDAQSSTLALPRSRAQRLAYAAVIASTQGQIGRMRELIASARKEAIGSPIETTINRVEEKLDAS